MKKTYSHRPATHGRSMSRQGPGSTLKVVKIGALRGRSIPWQGKYGFKWTSSFKILGILYNLENMENITKINIYRKLGDVKKLIRIWHARNLTAYGKITIIKSLLMSKFTHMLLSLPSPSKELLDELNNFFMISYGRANLLNLERRF